MQPVREKTYSRWAIKAFVCVLVACPLSVAPGLLALGPGSGLADDMAGAVSILTCLDVVALFAIIVTFVWASKADYEIEAASGAVGGGWLAISGAMLGALALPVLLCSGFLTLLLGSF